MVEEVRPTEKQRQWVLRRDNQECQFINLEKGERCRAKHYLHVHHIVAFKYASEVLKWKPEKVNDPENLITLCEDCHLMLIHPEVGRIAKPMYKYTKESYDKVIHDWHRMMIRARKKYWWTLWDDMLKMIARIRTWDYLQRHPNDKFPKNKRRNKK